MYCYAPDVYTKIYGQGKHNPRLDIEAEVLVEFMNN